MRFWFKQSWIAFDQFLNAFFFGGWADETMSSVLWRMEAQGKAPGELRPVVDWIAREVFRDPDHCRTAYESERARNQSPPEERNA